MLPDNISDEASRLHYVGALTPYHHKSLIDKAISFFDQGNDQNQAYREKRFIWDEERTVVIYFSKELRAGQLRGIYRMLEKKEQELKELQMALAHSKTKKYAQSALEAKILNLLDEQYAKQLVHWSLDTTPEGQYQLQFVIALLTKLSHVIRR